MRIIVGLGNPGKEYENTRHNAGFLFVDKLIQTKEFSDIGKTNKYEKNKKLDAETLIIKRDGEDVLVAKPTTFMNNSGRAVVKILEYYKCGIENLIVVSDDKDIPLGQIRIRNEGGSAGHKGLQSIIDVIKSEQITRIRIGIGPKKGNQNKIENIDNLIETEDYVLSQFTKREKPILNRAIDETIREVIESIGKKNNHLIAHTINIE